jgi:RNA polymerase sigma-70 factor (ECF subfamily)
VVAVTTSGAAHHLPVIAAPASSLLAWLVARDGWLAPKHGSDGSADVVRRAACGDQDAFERLVRPAGERLLGIARKILRDPDAAEDAVQQAVIQAWRELPRLREPERFEAWLTKLLVSACYQEARRSRRHAARVNRVASATLGSSTEPATEDGADALADRQLNEQAFLTLTPAQRAIVVLRHYADLPLAEVAAIVGVPPGTARSRLHYALRALRAALEAADRPTIEDLVR